jgi:hypothetical protein
MLPLAGKLDPKLDVILVPRVIKTSIVGNHVPFLKIVPNQIGRNIEQKISRNDFVGLRFNMSFKLSRVAWALPDEKMLLSELRLGLNFFAVTYDLVDISCG